jgi:hypothetical protein
MFKQAEVHDWLEVSNVNVIMNLSHDGFGCSTLFIVSLLGLGLLVSSESRSQSETVF